VSVSTEHGHGHPGAATSAAPARPGWFALVNATPMSRARAGILLALLALTAGSWAYLLTREHGTGPTMGLSALLFLGVWVAMMTATMFPAVAPMILMYARINATKRTKGMAWVPTWLFVAGYLLVWTGLGLVAYVAALGAEDLAARSGWVHEHAARLGGAMIVLAGAYQFSRLKDRCLTECRSPMAFVMQYWRDGRGGAVRMGVHHGWHCAGCCWAIMVAMFPLGMMNIAALAGVTAFVYAEKVLPGAKALRYGAGVALIAYGLLVLVEPAALPGSMTHHLSHSAGLHG
jgi:predicted metal-binding membrane protein